MPGVDLGSLQVRLEARTDALMRNLSVLTRNTARAMINRLGRDTPVDTGEAVSNWQVSLTGPPVGVLPPYVPGKHGSTQQANIKAMLAAARAVIPGFYVARGEVIYIGNNARHIGRLNAGWSAQAPAGFVEAATLAGAAHVRSAAPIITGTFTDNVSE